MRALIGSGTRNRPLRTVYGGKSYNTTSAGSRRICWRINVSEYTSAVGAHTQIFIRSRSQLKDPRNRSLPLAAQNRHLLFAAPFGAATVREDRKSTRLNSSHANISYAV